MMQSKLKDKRVIFIINSGEFGGAEKLNFDIAKGLSKRGYKIVFFTSSKKVACEVKKNQWESKFTKRCFEPLAGKKDFLLFLLTFLPVLIYYWYLFISVKKEGDIIFVSGFNEKLLVTVPGFLSGYRIIWSEYGVSELKRKYKGLLIYLFKILSIFSEKIITISKYAEKGLKLEIGIPERKLVVIYPGLPAPISRSNLSRELIVGAVSRLVREKGYDYLLRAIKTVIKENPKVKLLLVGEGSYLPEIEKQAKAIGISNNLIIKGFVDNILPQLSQMKVFVFPSVWELEGFGISLIEAMREGLPCVAFNFGPLPEIIDHGKNGLLVTYKDSQDLATKINWLLKNESKAVKLGKAAQEKVLKKFEYNRMIDQYLQVFNKP